MHSVRHFVRNTDKPMTMSAIRLLVLHLCCLAVAAQDTSLESVVSQLAQDVDNLQARLALLEANGNGRGNVAFSVYITGPDVQAVEDAKLIFGGTIVNTGDAYNTATGEFVAPYAGNYFFIINCDVSEDYQDLFINKNGHHVFEADKDDWATTHVSGSGIVSLEVGDVVTTNHMSGRGKVDNGRESTFSGFLI